MLKKSNVLTLPHENTLRDYTKFTSTQSGWNTDVIDRAILDFSILDDPLKQNISLLFDEVKVKSGLVYCSESGRLIGFCDLGSVNNDIQNFCINESETSEPGIASHIMTIMIRGIFSNLECVVAHYPCKGFTSYQLFWIIWHGIGILEKYGLIVRALVCDGATPNRKFYRIHGQNQDLCYFTNNEYGDEINLYFICDAPHLMKTTRNNFENSGWNNKTRNLMLNGKPIKWSQIVTLVEGDIHGMGLRLLPRISYEHLHLTPTLRMRVKLAVQILSSSVANALQLKGNPETESTQLFIRMFDKFFDCLNVSNTKSGIFQRKPTCAPYTNINDWRFKWLEEDFLKFLTKWEQEGENQADLSKKEKKQLCLSRETLEGLRITVKSFVELGKQLLLLPNVRFLLSEKFNQDPLEEYFSKQRGMGGFCDNPTVGQFQNNALKLQVANAPAVMASTRGNCQTRQNAQPIEAPLSKRKHKRH
ncbi:Hypothetical predicted protein [Mytilus galloprovincialis]|nr:Hypothetical predicted protein [Mytilus galloprovincialis]